MKKIISVLMAALMLLSVGQAAASEYIDCFEALIAYAAGENSLEGFDAELSKLLQEYPTDNAFSQIVVDVNNNTITTDDNEEKVLESFEADYCAVDTSVPVIPVLAVLEESGIEASIDDETGEVVVCRNGKDERYSFAGEYEEVEEKISGEILDSKIEDGIQTIVTDEEKITRTVGYMTEEQAEESFNLESEYSDGKFYITNPYQTMRISVYMKSGKKLDNAYGAVKKIDDSNGYYVLQFDSQESTKSAYEKLLKRSDTENVFLDKVVKASAISERKGAELIQSDRYKKYLKNNSKNSKIVVAVIDTGVDSKHEFLKSRMLSGRNFTGEGKANDASDVYGHGTHVAGIIVDNTPSNVKILPVKALSDSGSGTELMIARAIRYAANNGANVINMSLGGICHGGCEIEKATAEAIKKGVTVCVAAGNETYDTKNVCPAKISKCITVAACDCEGNQIANFSNYGSSVDVTAPGIDILSCKSGGGYVKMSGTSMATPFAAAACAMLLVNEPKLTPSQVEAKLKATCCDMLLKGNDKHSGAGIINFGILLGDKQKKPDSISVETTEYVSDFISTLIPFRCNTSVYCENGICTDRTITISNSNSSVATYDGRFVTPKASGKTVITVKLSNSESMTLTLDLKKKETWIDYAASSYAGGNGTSSSPYLISNAAQLSKFAYDVRTKMTASTKHYKLTKDIDLAGKDWITARYVDLDTVGQIIFADKASSFTGVFDGNNHIIKNMTVLDTHLAGGWGNPEFLGNIWYPHNSGFIDWIEGGTVKNLGIVNASCYSTDSGILCNTVMQGSRIENCFTTGFNCGNGFCGEISNYDIVLKNCFSAATVLRNGFTSTVYSSKEGYNVTLSNCFFCGELLGNDTGGDGNGFTNTITENEDLRFTKIYNCFAAPSGIINNGFANSNISNTVLGCYYSDNAKIGIKSDKCKSNLKSKPISFFKTKSSYTTKSNWNNASSWDFKKTWNIDPKINNGFPYLKAMPFTQSTASTNTWLDSAAKSYAGGNGTKSSPYLISNASELARIAYYYRYGGGENTYFKLTKDIDLNGKLWYPIGGGANIDIEYKNEVYLDRRVFMGNIDGNGKTIKNMKISSNGDLVGFISVYGSGTIKNLNFENAVINGRNYVAAICGQSRNNAKIISCNTSGTVTAKNKPASISAENISLSEIIGCQSNMKFSFIADEPYTFSGGICADNSGTVESCYFSGTLKVDPSTGAAGQIVGVNRTIIKNCYCKDGELSAAGSKIYNSFSTDSANKEFTLYNSSGEAKVYPLSELNERCRKEFDFDNIWYADKDGCPALRKVTAGETQETLPSKYWSEAKSYAGGKGTKSNPYLIATPEQLVRVIKQFEDNKYYRVIRNIDLSGKLWPTTYDPGKYTRKIYFDGNNKTISNLTMKNGDGLINYNVSGYIKRLHLTDVKGSSNCALVSMLSGKILDCSVSGKLDGAIYFGTTAQMSDVAGLVGDLLDGAIIERCSVNMDIRGYRNVSGFSSYLFGSNVTIRDCCFKGTLFGLDGGFFGNRSIEQSCRRCYVVGNYIFDGQNEMNSGTYYNSDIFKSDYGKPRTTAQMKTKATYSGWDFENVWAIDPKGNEGYPYLRREKSYKIKYVLNGGTNASYPETDYISGNTVTLREPTKKNCAFLGWYLKSDFSGKAVKTISSSKKGNITLYAKWAPAYNIAFYSNGGKGSMKNKSIPVGKTGTLPKCTFTKTGYRFVGWATEKNGAVKYKDAQEVKNLSKKVGATVKLYAVWKANTYNILFASNGGKGQMDSQSMTYGKSANLKKNTFTAPKGKHFSGWATRADNRAKYKDAQSVKNLTAKNKDNIELYAVWTNNTYTVEFNSNGGSGKMKSQKMTCNKKTALSANTFTAPKGKKFAGWSTTKNGKASYKNKQSVKNLTLKNNGKVTLYAVWK